MASQRLNDGGLSEQSMDISICAAQCRVSIDPQDNLGAAKKAFLMAAKANCSIICFPEMFLTGPISAKEYDEEMLQGAKKTFSSLSKQCSMVSIMGSVMEKRKGRFYNTSFVFDDRGRQIGQYRKIHLTKGETRRITPGKVLPVFKTKFGTIGVQICRDLLYPEITKALMKKGAQIIFCPSFWASRSTQYSAIYNKKYFGKKEPREVDALCSARAIENAVYFIYSNGAGTFNKGKGKSTLLGRTQVASPFYGTTLRLDHNRPAILTAAISFSVVKEAQDIYRTSKP